MREFFHSVKFKIILCIAALLLGLMTYVAVAAGTQTLPEQVISTVTYPFVTAANAISNGVNGFIDKWVNADTYNANDMYGGFTINQGSSNWISLNDPVITSVGLIGRVTDIAPNYAKVSTILSPQVNVGVYTMRTKATGVIENSTSTAEQGLCLMSQILKDTDVEPGDVIVTAGQSGLFPEGIIVGTVKEVYDDPNGLSKHALIEPAEDCFAITTVYAVVDFDGKGLSFGDIAQ